MSKHAWRTATIVTVLIIAILIPAFQPAHIGAASPSLSRSPAVSSKEPGAAQGQLSTGSLPGPVAPPPTPTPRALELEPWTVGETSVSKLSEEEREKLCGVPAEVLEWERSQQRASGDLPALTASVNPLVPTMASTLPGSKACGQRSMSEAKR